MFKVNIKTPEKLGFLKDVYAEYAKYILGEWSL